MPSHADRQPAAQIKFPRLKLAWKPAAIPQAKWWLGLFGLGYRETPRRLFLYASVRGLLAWGGSLALAGYLAGTAALAWYWGKNPYNHITYADLVLPTHWGQLREKRGQGYIDQGIHLIRADRDYAGVMLLNRGVSLRPSDLRGRLVLAQILMGMGYLHRGQQVLEEGLAFGFPPRQYREALFRLANYLEDYEAVLRLADRMEKDLPPDDPGAQRWLLGQKVAALEKLQRIDDIDRLRQARGGAPSYVVEEAWARLQAAQGRPADALRELQAHPDRFGVPADRYELELALAAASGDAGAARAASAAWRQLEPTRPQPRIQELLALIQLGDDRAARDRLHDFFIFFASDKGAVVQLFKRLDDLPDVRWLQAAHQEAADTGALSLEAHIATVQGLLMAGRVAEAQAEFNLTTALIEKARVPDGGWSKGTRLLIAVINSDSPSNRALFFDFFRNQRLTPDAFRFALRSLRRAKGTEVAAELSILARNRFPAFRDEALSGLAVVETGKPRTEQAPAFRTELEAAAELRRIDEDLKQGNIDSAFARLKAVEQAGFDNLRAELLPRRIQVHGERREQSELAAALQLYLASPRVNQAWLRDLAEGWARRAQRDSAATVARETREKFPQARWASEILGQPPAAPGAPETVAAPKFVVRETPSAPMESPTAAGAAGPRNEVEARVELKRIDEELDAGRFPAALERIKSVERAAIPGLRQELLLRRIRAHGSLGEQTELVAALGIYLPGKDVSQSALRDLAVRWNADGQRDSALSLLRETLVKFPQARWALDLRKKIEGDLLVAPGKSD